MVDHSKRVAKLADGIAKFERSVRTRHDYEDLLAVVGRVTRSSDGLMWPQIEEAIALGLAAAREAEPATAK